MSTVIHVTDFPADYTASVVGAIPYNATPFVFSYNPKYGTTPPPGPALRVHVKREDADGWYGHFQGGGTAGIYALCHTPIRGHICVIARGQAYYGPVAAPDNIIPVSACPIVDLVASATDSVLVLASYTHLVMLLKNGSCTSTQVASDGIRELTIKHGSICGKGWSAPLDRWEPFEICIRALT